VARLKDLRRVHLYPCPVHILEASGLLHDVSSHFLPQLEAFASHHLHVKAMRCAQDTQIEKLLDAIAKATLGDERTLRGPFPH
jgi:hypothetical protein